MNLPQAQEEDEGDDEGAYRYAVSQVIDDESDLVVHWILSLGRKKKRALLSRALLLPLEQHFARSSKQQPINQATKLSVLIKETERCQRLQLPYNYPLQGYVPAKGFLFYYF